MDRGAASNKTSSSGGAGGSIKRQRVNYVRRVGTVLGVVVVLPMKSHLTDKRKNSPRQQCDVIRVEVMYH
ncbi:hypothetical protein EJB05_39810, partial [Eragrostis curvula]